MARRQVKPDGRLQPSNQGQHPQAIRKSVRLQEIQQRQRGQVTSKKKSKKGIKLFPSNTLSKEVQRSPLRATTPSERLQGSSPDPAPKEVEADPRLNRKRKQGPEPSKDQDEPSKKRARISVEGSAIINPIDYWIKEGSWPKEFFEPGAINMNQLSRKHSLPTVSYAQSVKQGDNPPAYTPGHESTLARAGIFIEEYDDPTDISSTSKDLCATLLQDRHKPPEHSLFEDSSFSMLTRRVRSRNERRIERDIMSSITPSAELLYIRGALHLKHLTEELSAEWTRCVALAGPRPTPDFAVGFMSSAFTLIEVEKLKFHTTAERATQFTEMLYFPFLLCEVKRGDAGLNAADRQNMHSASIAVNAIVQLCRAVPEAEDLHRKILVFSISHDHEMVKIYGHYALIEGDKPTFHRHMIHSFSILAVDGKDRWTAYKFVRQVYDIFVPIHLERIQRAIAQLPIPITESIVSSVTAETEQVLAGSHEVASSYGISGSQNIITKMLPPSVPSSQNTGLFKKPRLQPKAMLQQEIDLQKQQFDNLQDQLAREREQGRREREENKQRQDREREQNQQRLDREREEGQQRLDREREEGEQRLDREREESKQRHTELMQRMDELKREKDDQKEQIKELTNLLKQQLSGNRSSQ